MIAFPKTSRFGTSPSAPTFSADGRSVYGIRQHDLINSQLVATRFWVTDVLAQAGRGALQAGAVGAARRHLQAAVDLAGPAAPAELVFDLARALISAGG